MLFCRGVSVVVPFPRRVFAGMQFAWLTDIHLNAAAEEVIENLLAEVRSARPAGVLISGDIAEATSLQDSLTRIADTLDCPVYFVLGNHDYYFGSIQRVRQDVRTLCAGREPLVYLTDCEPVMLSERTVLVGHDGWADGRCGDYANSTVMMSDYQKIGDLIGLDSRTRLEMLQALAEEAAGHVRRVLASALERAPETLLLTHVPPFREACWHQGQIADDQWAPHFSSRVMGDAILEIMTGRPDRQLTVLCGHTHSAGQIEPAVNVRVLTGAAEYGFPAICRILQIP